MIAQLKPSVSSLIFLHTIAKRIVNEVYNVPFANPDQTLTTCIEFYTVGQDLL